MVGECLDIVSWRFSLCNKKLLSCYLQWDVWDMYVGCRLYIDERYSLKDIEGKIQIIGKLVIFFLFQ